MHSNILTVFLSMSLIAALHSFHQSQQLFPQHWFALIYFILNRIRYFHGDSPWASLGQQTHRKDLRFEKSIGLFIMMANLLVGLIIGMHVHDLEIYFWFSAISQLIGVSYLAFEKFVLIDPQRDTGKIRITRIVNSWIGYCVFEGITFALMAFLWHVQKDIVVRFPSLNAAQFQNSVIYVGFLMLMASMLIDWIQHQDFLYPR
jgi:hypothetical protein